MPEMLFTSSVSFNIDSCRAGATSFSWLVKTCIEEKFWALGGNGSSFQKKKVGIVPVVYREEENKPNSTTVQNVKY